MHVAGRANKKKKKKEKGKSQSLRERGQEQALPCQMEKSGAFFDLHFPGHEMADKQAHNHHCGTARGGSTSHQTLFNLGRVYVSGGTKASA